MRTRPIFESTLVFLLFSHEKVMTNVFRQYLMVNALEGREQSLKWCTMHWAGLRSEKLLSRVASILNSSP